MCVVVIEEVCAGTVYDHLRVSSGMRIAFFGGTFDPPHYGHLAIARAAADCLRLDKILFAPVGKQPLKQDSSVASFEERAAMVGLAIARGHAL